MRYLKFWKSYKQNKINNKNIYFLTEKMSILKLTVLNNKLCYNRKSDKICLYTLKFKTQTNFLKTSRFKLLNDLTFNKHQSFEK